jgi:hypothetical protein
MRIAILVATMGAGACSFGSSGAAGSASGGTPGDGTDGTAAPPGTGSGSSTDAAASDTGASSGSIDADGTSTSSDAGTDTTRGVEPPATGTDADGSSSDTGDSTTGDPALPVGPFDAPLPIAELNSDEDDDDPSVTADELFIVFNSARSGSSDIWWSERETADADWDPPQSLDALNGGYITGPSVTPDGLVILWSSNVAPSTGLDVWMATRRDRDATFGAPERVVELASAGSDIAPRWYPALGVAWLCSDRPGGVGDTDPWTAPWPMGDPAPGPLALVPELSTVAADCAVGLSADGREAFIETTRPGGTGEWDLWRVYRDDPTAPFQPADLQPASELNSESFDIDPWPSADGHRLYMASDRDGGLDLFVAARER